MSARGANGLSCCCAGAMARRSIAKWDGGNSLPAAMLWTTQAAWTTGRADLDLSICLSLVSGRLSQTMCVTVSLL